MKKILGIVVVFLMAASFYSCKKCYTCTADPAENALSDSTLSDEICGNGRIFNEELEQYEKNGWDCQQN